MTRKSFSGGRSVVTRIVHGAISGLLAMALCTLLWLAGAFTPWEAVSWDWRASLLARPGSATDQVKLVLVDQESLDWAYRENGLTWPWPREVYGVIVDYLRRQGAKAVAFDILFTEPSSFGVDDDLRFAAAIDAAGNVVVPASLGTSGLLAEDLPETFNWPSFHVAGLDGWQQQQPSLTAHPRATLPIGEFSDKAFLVANVHVEPDTDGTFRRINPIDSFADRPFPVLGLACWLAGNPGSQLTIADQQLHADTKRISFDDQGRTLLRFRGRSGTHQSFSAASVIESELLLREGLDPTIKDADAFRDKYVFIGFAAPGLLDLHPVPTDSAYPGAEVHATFLDNLLAGDFLTPTSDWFTLGVALGFALLTGVLVSLSSTVSLILVLTPFGMTLPVLFALAAYVKGYWSPLVFPEASGALALILALTGNFFAEGRQKLFIKRAFKHYLSHEVIEQLLATPEMLKLGGERRTISIFFSDLQGFTTISESLDPEQLTALLNDYLSAMTDIITEEGGTIDKYEGDAIIAFWNAPVAIDDHRFRAVRAALRCQAKLADLRPIFEQRLGVNLKMRIGLNTGPAIVGNMGSHSSFDYTMIGDSVNLAARLEGANKEFGTYTMVSAATYDPVKALFDAREIGRLRVVGKTEPVTVFEPLPEDLPTEQRDIIKQFQQGLEHYYAGEFAEAHRIFSEISAVDSAAKAYSARCAILTRERPNPWDGTWTLTSKG